MINVKSKVSKLCLLVAATTALCIGMLFTNIQNAEAVENGGTYDLNFCVYYDNLNGANVNWQDMYYRPETKGLKKGSSVTLPKCPAQAGLEFDGWSIWHDGDKKLSDGQQITFTDADFNGKNQIDLFAHFKVAGSNQSTFKSNNPSQPQDPKTGPKHPGQQYDEPPVGYEPNKDSGKPNKDGKGNRVSNPDKPNTQGDQPVDQTKPKKGEDKVNDVTADEPSQPTITPTEEDQRKIKGISW